jgi:phage-related baseplate assembly protein
MAVIDLSQLPPPQIVDEPDFETLLTERKAEFVALYPAEEQEAVARTLTLESEPVVKILQENVYRELLLRQRINEAAQAVMVAYSGSGDLDNLGANNNVSAGCYPCRRYQTRPRRRKWNLTRIIASASRGL